jgi:hypothetical protein
VWALSGFLVVALVCAGLAYRDGTRWRDRATANREEADQLSGELETTSASLEESQADATALERRVSRLANEKAQAEDAQVTAETAAQQLAKVAAIGADVAADLDACLDSMNEFTEVLVNIQYYDSDSANEFARAVGRQCGQARAANNDLQDLLRGYGA